MKPKKKSRRCRASVSIQALDLAISRFIHSLGQEYFENTPVQVLVTMNRYMRMKSVYLYF